LFTSDGNEEAEMETRTYHTMSKLGWPRGPWDDEPDKEQYEDLTTGLPCLVKRNHMGVLCGYVGVAEGHPWYLKHYSDVMASVHGGLTYSAFCTSDIIESEGICHVPGPGEPDKVWWLGFDCAHYMDIKPNMIKYPGYADGTATYKSVSFVKKECASLARQALAALSNAAE
jgi:hypothetical protein